MPYPSFFLRGYSIDTPSLVHRFDGESMENRWRNDGLTMEYHKHNYLLKLLFPLKQG